MRRVKSTGEAATFQVIVALHESQSVVRNEANPKQFSNKQLTRMGLTKHDIAHYRRLAKLELGLDS